MLGLFACAEPELELAVEPPAAEHAVGVSAAEFVGPTRVDACVDPVEGLRSGAFGWRVLVLGAAEDERARVKEWAAADERWKAVCGRDASKRVLLAVDGAAPFDEKAVHRALAAVYGTGIVPWLLVADPTPGAEVPERKEPERVEPRLFSTLLRGTGGWAVLTSGPGVPALETPSAKEAVAHVVSHGVSSVVITGGHTTWGEMVEGLDALAAVGLRPAWALTVGEGEERSPNPGAPSESTFRLRIGDTLAVLPLPLSSDRGILLQMIGRSSNPIADDADSTRALEHVLGPPDSIGNDADAMRGLEQVLGPLGAGAPVEDFGQGSPARK